MLQYKQGVIYVKKPSKTERKLDRELEKYSNADVSQIKIGPWPEAKETLLERGFKEKDGGYLVQKKLSLWKTVSCDCVYHAEIESVADGIKRAFERSRQIKELNFSSIGGMCYIALLYKERVSPEDLNNLVRIQASTIAVEGTIGMNQWGENLLFILVDKSTGTDYFVEADPALGAVYTHGCKVLRAVFGEK